MASRRRGHGEGLVHKRADGRWEGRLDAGQFGSGRRRKSVYGRTRVEVVDKLRHAKVALDHGLPIIDERTRFDDYLQTWLEEVVRPARSRATLQGYEVNVRKHIVPLVGHRPLAKVSAADVQGVLNAKRAEGLAPRTVQYIHATMRAALGVAYRWGLVPRNVASLVDPVTLDRPPVTPFTDTEVSQAARRGPRPPARCVLYGRHRPRAPPERSARSQLGRRRSRRGNDHGAPGSREGGRTLAVPGAEVSDKPTCPPASRSMCGRPQSPPPAPARRAPARR